MIAPARPPAQALALLPLLLVVPTAACSSSPENQAKIDPAHADVIFQGSATDAELSAMLAVTPVDDPAHAATFDNPKDLSALPGTPIIPFTWHDGQAAADPRYLLAYRTLDTNQPLFRVFTSSTSYTPDQTAWAKVATGAWTTLQITSAAFSGDGLATGSSPIDGQLIKFCIGTWQ